MSGAQKENQYKYYAFISYKRSDGKWAEWLYRNLQNYRLPSKLCKRNRELVKRLCPIFLDKEDLVPGKLDDNLREQISLSKYFISICSRHSLENPKYIDMELQYFLETHDNDYTKVIPFIVDASPQPEKECFSPGMQALCEQYQLVGANVNEKGKRRAFLKVVACMHGMRVTEIESADDVRRRKNMILSSLGGILVAVSCMFAVNYWWQHLAVHTDYYVSYVWRNNVPEGVGEIAKRDLSDYARYYRIESVDNRVCSISYLNYGGTLVPLADEVTVLNQGASKVEFTYSGEKEKHLYTAKYYDYNMLPIVCYQYSEDGTHVTMLQDEKTGVSAYAGQGIGVAEMENDPRVRQDRTYVSRYVQELSEDGFVMVRHYAYGEEYAGTSDGNGIFGYRLAYDESGNLTEVTYLDTADGAVVGESRGVGFVNYQYDEACRVQKVSYRNADGEPVMGAGGYCRKEYTWSDNNNVAQISYQDTEENPAMVNGYASLKYGYEGVELKQVTYYGPDGEKTEFAGGYASAIYETDEDGEIISCRYLDAEGAPTVDRTFGTYGYDVYKQSENERYQMYVDREGEPMLTTEGYAYIYTTQDAFQYPLRNEYRDAENKPCTEHYAACTYAYDEVYHNVTEWRFFDEKDEPMVNPELGVAAVITKYDSRGFMTLSEYRDEKGQLCNGESGYAKMVASSTLEGTFITETAMYYDADDKPVINPAIEAYGYESTRYANGQLAGIVYLDKDKRPYFNERKGFAGVNYLYDEYGYISYVSYFGENLQSVMVDGFASVSVVNDAHGNMLVCEYYNDDGDFAVNEQVGYAGMVATYEDDILTAIDYFGAENGEPVIAVNELAGFASVHYTYDEAGRLNGIEYYGADGKHMNHLHNGYAAIVAEYDENGATIRNSVWVVENGALIQIQ